MGCTSIKQPILHFDGKIDEVAIFNKALSAKEIVKLMHRRPNKEDKSLIGYWDLNEKKGQLTRDYSMNSNNAILGSSKEADGSDPKWVDSDAPVGIDAEKSQ